MNSVLKRKLLLALLLLITFVVIGLIGAVAYAQIHPGASGQQVVTIQTKLKRWGYYDGPIDGKYGAQTVLAVQKFQKKHGLFMTGVVNVSTAEKLGISLTAPAKTTYTPSNTNAATGDVYLLARLAYSEARGEPYRGQVAVAAVVLNRVKSAQFPNTIAGVIYQPNAFSVVNDGQINLTPDETAIRAARDAMNGVDPTGGCLFYYNPAKTTNKWMLAKPIATVIGRHVFAF